MNKFLSRLWSVSALLPLAILGLLLAAQTLPSLDSRALWFSDEIRYANVFEQLIYAKKWLVMYLNGVPYPDKPPVYFWFLTAFLPFFGGAKPALFFAGAAASAFVFIAAMLTMNRLVLKGGRENGLAAGLVLLTCFYFVALTHYSRMDLLFTGLITFSHVCLFRAWQRERALGWMVSGFALAAIATLTKGPLGLVFPLLASVVYLAWSGRLYRLARRDVAIGFGVAVAILVGWIAAAWFAGEHALVENIFYKQIYRRAIDASHHEQPFWHYFATLPAAFLPWTFVALLLPFGKLLKFGFWKELWYARKADVCTTGAGQSYMWCALLSGFVLLTCLSTKIVVYLMPLFPILALLTAKTILGFDAAKTRKLVLAIAGLFVVLAAATAVANFFTQWPITLKGIYAMTAICAVIAALLWRYVSRWDIRPALLTLGILMTLWVQPLAFLAVPELDAVMSPKEQGELMGEYVRDGYTPAAYKIYSGVYTYYCGTDILETQDLDLLTEMAATENKFVLGMQRRYWESWENRPENLRIVHEQWIVDRPYVLLVNTPVGGAPSAQEAPVVSQEIPEAPATQTEIQNVAPTPLPAVIAPEVATEPATEAMQPAPVQTPAPAAPAPVASAQDSARPEVSASPAQEAAPQAPMTAPLSAAPAQPDVVAEQPDNTSKALGAIADFASSLWQSLTDAVGEFWETWNTPEGDVPQGTNGTGMFKQAMQWLSDVTKGDTGNEPQTIEPVTEPSEAAPAVSLPTEEAPALDSLDEATPEDGIAAPSTAAPAVEEAQPTPDKDNAAPATPDSSQAPTSEKTSENATAPAAPAIEI